ncbi:PKD domain-containing protein [Kitasatospora paranensis]|uniref:PKD domain-containing protein n=1 Tax=Kitasatospora paranensis TaxID=258053 RepID=A0ABW2FSK2_9ACTN
MRINRAAGLTVACLTGLMGLATPAVAETATTLYVNKAAGAGCSDAGTGTAEQPYCTISAAVAVAQPGQTVNVAPGAYNEQVVVNRSGEPGRPITIRDTGTSGYAKGPDAAKPTLVIDGVHDIAVQGLTMVGGASITGSDRITLDRVRTTSQGGRPAMVIGGASHDVAYIRSVALGTADASAVRVEGGATGTLLGRDRFDAGDTPGAVTVVDAPHTTLTNNTLPWRCSPAFAVSGDSAGVNVFNNVVSVYPPTTCTAGYRPLISVAASAVSGSRADYNLVQQQPGYVPYSWAGTAYADPAGLLAGTGQGGHDLVMPSTGHTYDEDALLIDSADASAPGVLDTDAAGNGPTDDPQIANTGTGVGYLDRGAYETQDSLSGVDMSLDTKQAPYGTTVTADARAVDTWPKGLTYRFDFGDGTVVTTDSTRATHVYTAACDCKATVTAVNGAGVSVVSSPVAIKVTTPGPVPAPVLTLSPYLPNDTSPMTHIQPLSVLVDADVPASPWPVAGYTYDFGDGFVTDSFSLPMPTHTYRAPGDYTVTVTAMDVKGRTASSSAVFHAAYAASEYTPVTPFRLVDTRKAVDGLHGGQSMQLRVSDGYPDARKPATSSSPSAVVLNVTATKATSDTYLTLFPSGQDRPKVSHLNVRAGQTVANLVTVPVGADGTVQLFNFLGRTDVIVDFVGYYQPNAGQKFSPAGPSRLSDASMTHGTTRTLKVAGTAGVPADATAVVVNLTADRTTGSGFLTAYPHGIALPTVSNLNFDARQTVANQAIVPIGADGSIDVYNFGGTTRVVVDVFGYYSPGSKGVFTPTVPVRLADTRYDGRQLPVSGGGQLGLQIGGAHGVPADATAAVLNVTATRPTAPGYLTVWPDGTDRPGTSNLNFAAGATVPNHVITRLGSDGAADVYNFGGSTHVFADLFGWFTNG